MLVTCVRFSEAPAQPVTCCRGSRDSAWTQATSGRFLGSAQLLEKRTEGKSQTWKENKSREFESNPYTFFPQSSIFHSFSWYIKQFHDTYKTVWHTSVLEKDQIKCLHTGTLPWPLLKATTIKSSCIKTRHNSAQSIRLCFRTRQQLGTSSVPILSDSLGRLILVFAY